MQKAACDFRLKHAAVAGGVLGASAVLVMMLASAEIRHDIVGSPLFILIPSFMVGAIGASAGVAIFLVKTRRKIHPTLGALLGGILTSAATAFVMLLLFAAKNFDLSGNGASVSTGLAAGFDAAGWMLVYVKIVFPVSIITGSAVGWLLNRQ